MTTGLESSLSRLSIDHAHGMQPVRGDAVTVRVMTPQQERDTRQKVQNLIDARERTSLARKNVAENAQAQIDAQKMIAEGQKELEVVRKNRAFAKQGIADAKAGQAKALQMQQEAHAGIAQAKANMVALDVETINNLNAIVTGLTKFREFHKANPDAVAKIDALRSGIIQYRDNLPSDANSRKITMDNYKKQATVLVQGLSSSQTSKQVQNTSK